MHNHIGNLNTSATQLDLLISIKQVQTGADHLAELREYPPSAEYPVQENFVSR